MSGQTERPSRTAHAIKFANTADRINCVSFIDPKTKATYKYSKATNEFAIVTQNGYVVTYYKPPKGYAYYKKQEIKYGGKKK